MQITWSTHVRERERERERERDSPVVRAEFAIEMVSAGDGWTPLPGFGWCVQGLWIE